MASDSDKASRRSSRPQTGRSVADYRRRRAERQTRLDELVEAVLVADEQREGVDANLDDEIGKLETKLDEKIAKLRAEHATKVEQLRAANEARTKDLEARWTEAFAELSDFASISEVAFALGVSERHVRTLIKQSGPDGNAQPEPAAEQHAEAEPAATPVAEPEAKLAAEPTAESEAVTAPPVRDSA